MNTVKDILSELKWLIVFGLLAIISVCMWRYAERYIFVDIPSEIVEYCEKSYPDDNFKFVKFKSEMNNMQSKSAVVENSKGIQFTVTRQYLEGGELEYVDNYVGVRCYDYIDKQLASKIPEGVTYSILIDDSVFPFSEKRNTDVAEILDNLDTVIAVSLKDTHAWSMEEVEEFCKSLPFRVNAVLVADGVQMHFSTTREFGVVYR